MKTITVAVPDHVYRRAEMMAAQRDASVNAPVRDFVIRLAENGSDFDRRKRLQQEVLASVRDFRASDRHSREEIHNRKSG